MLRKTRIRSIYRIPGGPDAAAEVRVIAVRELDGIESPDQIEKTSLLLSEIAAERVGRSTQDHPRLTIDVRKSARRNRWAVIDRGVPALPAGLRSTALDKIADAWGVSRKSGLTRTWFELDNEEDLPVSGP